MPISDEFHHILQKLIEQHQPKNEEELQNLLNSMIGKRIDDFKMAPETNEEKARELIYEAYHLPIDKGRRRAKKALKIYPDCIEAYEYLGNSYAYYDKAVPYFEKGVEVGRRIFGGKFLKENKGYFYGITETRPFMRCLSQVAECHHNFMRVNVAIDIWKEMLELNPNDNQGVRYQLASGFLEAKMWDEFKIFRKEWKNDASMMMSFPNALHLFKTKGDGKESRNALRLAKDKNKFVIPLLLKTYPPDEMPDGYMLGSEEEAIIYVHYGWRSWKWTEGAIEWLKQMNYHERI